MRSCDSSKMVANEEEPGMARVWTLSSFLDACLSILPDVIRRAGRCMREFDRSALDVEGKTVMGMESNESPSEANPISTSSSVGTDMVTAADRLVERMIREALEEHFSFVPIVGEEESGDEMQDAIPRRGPSFVVDPIDGTTNFCSDAPSSCVLVGATFDGTPVVGFTYDPYLDELIYAAQGRGAFCNGKRISVSSCTQASEALVHTNISADRRSEVRRVAFERLDRLSEYPVRAIRMLGSSGLALAHVAAGRADVFYEFGIKSWDICAGIVLVQEAGGCIADPLRLPLDVRNRRILAASSPRVGEEIINLLLSDGQEAEILRARSGLFPSLSGIMTAETE